MRTELRLLATTLLIGACDTNSGAGSSAGDAGNTPDVTTTADATITSDAPSADAAAEADVDPYACVDDDFKALKPLSGAGLDPEKGLLGERQARYIVHTTQLVVPPEGMAGFGADMQDIFAAMGKADGLIAVSLAGSTKCGFNRTLGVWRDEAAMWAFVTGPAHAKAMGNTTDYATAGRVHHWEATADEVEALTWEAAMARLKSVENSPVFE